MSDKEWIEEFGKGLPVACFYTKEAWARVRAEQRKVMDAGGPCPSLSTLWRDGDLDREKTQRGG